MPSVRQPFKTEICWLQGMRELRDCGPGWLEYDMDACCVPLVGEHPPHPDDGISSVLDLRLGAGISADSDSDLSGESWGMFGATVSCCTQLRCRQQVSAPLQGVPAAWAAGCRSKSASCRLGAHGHILSAANFGLVMLIALLA